MLTLFLSLSARECEPCAYCVCNLYDLGHCGRGCCSSMNLLPLLPGHTAGLHFLAVVRPGHVTEMWPMELLSEKVRGARGSSLCHFQGWPIKLSRALPLR